MIEWNDIPFRIARMTGAGPFVLVCEHASNFIPPVFDGLGLPPDLRRAHIAWDPGALAVAQAMSARLDAPLISGEISRLVYDCNRPPEAADAVPEVSEVYDIPGNRGLSPEALQARAEKVYHPFHAAVSRLIETRSEPPVLVTLHSFTPVYRGVRRAVELGILHDSDARMADAMLAGAGAAGRAALTVRRNQPYGPEDGVTHMLRRHGLSRGLLNVMIEIRNDLIQDADSQTAMAALLAGWVAEAAAACRKTAGEGAA
ncbi:MAG: N-formylglutamate amidohydrolase [Paracoccaceae bacterium]